MGPWFETVVVSIIALLGILLGRLFSRIRKPYWGLGYFLPAVLVAILVAGRCSGSLSFAQPFYWLTAGRAKFVVLAFAVTMGLTTPFSRLSRRYERIAICVLMAVVVIWFCLLPFLVPGLIRNHLLGLETRIDADGVCLQASDYTCGPAAAVTALRRLGLSAQEGEIAILSHASPVAGTLPACLCRAVQNRYGAEGLKCRYRRFDSIEQLNDAGVTLAVVRDTFLSDHCVAVLEVSDHIITVADPVLGKKTMSHSQFERIWRFSGIVLKRDPVRSI